MKKKNPTKKQKKPPLVVEEPRAPFVVDLTPDDFARTLRKVSRRVVPPDREAKGT